jgi:hypothetical protein
VTAGHWGRGSDTGGEGECEKGQGRAHRCVDCGDKREGVAENDFDGSWRREWREKRTKEWRSSTPLVRGVLVARKLSPSADGLRKRVEHEFLMVIT